MRIVPAHLRRRREFACGKQIGALRTQFRRRKVDADRFSSPRSSDPCRRGALWSMLIKSADPEVRGVTRRVVRLVSLPSKCRAPSPRPAEFRRELTSLPPTPEKLHASCMQVACKLRLHRPPKPVSRLSDKQKAEKVIIDRWSNSEMRPWKPPSRPPSLTPGSQPKPGRTRNAKEAAAQAPLPKTGRSPGVGGSGEATENNLG